MLTEKTINKKGEKKETGESKTNIKNKFEELTSFISQEREKGKMIDLSELIAKMEKVGKSIKNEKDSEELASLLENYLDNIRYSDPVLTGILVESSSKIFNHNWQIKEKKELPEASSENLWKESAEASRGLDKVLGRKLAKKIRRKIKEGISPDELYEKLEKKGFGKEVKPLMEEYEARYKGWRGYIEDEAEKIGEKLETYEMLKKMWQEGDIDKKGLVLLSRLVGPARELANVVFGDYQEVAAARKLLREIRKEEAKKRKKKNIISKVKKPFVRTYRPKVGQKGRTK